MQWQKCKSSWAILQTFNSVWLTHTKSLFILWCLHMHSFQHFSLSGVFRYFIHSFTQLLFIILGNPRNKKQKAAVGCPFLSGLLKLSLMCVLIWSGDWNLKILKFSLIFIFLIQLVSCHYHFPVHSDDDGLNIMATDLWSWIEVNELEILHKTY